MGIEGATASKVRFLEVIANATEQVEGKGRQPGGADRFHPVP